MVEILYIGVLLHTLPNSRFSDIMFVTWNWPGWEYFHHGNLPRPQILLIICLRSLLPSVLNCIASLCFHPGHTKSEPIDLWVSIAHIPRGKERYSKPNLMSIHKGFLSAFVLTPNGTHSAENPRFPTRLAPSGRIYSQMAVLCCANKNKLIWSCKLSPLSHPSRCPRRKFLPCLWHWPGPPR